MANERPWGVRAVRGKNHTIYNVIEPHLLEDPWQSVIFARTESTRANYDGADGQSRRPTCGIALKVSGFARWCTALATLA